MKKKILIIGATGLLGQPVARKLQENGFDGRIISRDGAKAGKLFGDAFEIVSGDPTNAAQLESALDGCNGVHINLRNQPEQIVAEHVARLGVAAGIERITYISGSTVREENRWFPLINHKFLAEQAIRNSGITYTIFRPTWFMESLPLFVRDGRAAIVGKKPTPYHWLAADDYAEMVTAVYTKNTAANQTLTLHGPEAISMMDALTGYCAAVYPDIKPSAMPFWLAKVLAALMRSEDMKTAVNLFAYFEKIGELGDPTEANNLLGAPTTTMNKWLARRG